MTILASILINTKTLSVSCFYSIVFCFIFVLAHDLAKSDDSAVVLQISTNDKTLFSFKK